MKFVDTNIFIYAIGAHPKFANIAKRILTRIEKGERGLTSTLVLSEIAWVLEAMGKQGEIKIVLELIRSFDCLEVQTINCEDLIGGAIYMKNYKIDFNDGVNLFIIEKNGIKEIYSNDKKHFGSINWLNMVFE